jgi:hypothetical protein
MIEFITSDLWFNIISSALAILSLILAFVFYYRGKNTKVPYYSRRSTTLLDRELIVRNPIKVTFLDRPVDTLTITYVALWNNGRATIIRDDIAATDPLRVVADDGFDLLAADIICENRPANNFSLSLRREENIAVIDFDFIDYRNGAVLRIYHTGGEDQPVDIVGTIKGAEGIKNADRAGELLGDILDRLTMELMSRPFRLVPRWWLKLTERMDSRQSFILYVLTRLPLIIIVGPFIAIYMVATTVVILASMLYFPIDIWRHRLPRELYLTFSYS